MSALNPPLTKDDFLNVDWLDAIANSERKDCYFYQKAFWERGYTAKAAGNFREQAVFEILTAVTNVGILSESNKDLFAQDFQRFTDEQLSFLAEIVSEVCDPELQARIADILWVRQRNYRMAQLAIVAYLKSAAEQQDPEDGYCFERIERAFRLACQIHSQIETVVAHIDAMLDRYQGEEYPWLSADLMKLLQEKRLGNSAKYANLAGKAANLAETAHDWRRARIHWQIKAKWHQLEKEGEQERKAAMRAAETFVQEAEDVRQQDTLPYSRASDCLRSAIEAFRRVRGTKEETAAAKSRAEEIHKRLLQYQQEIPKEAIFIGQEFDVSNDVKWARQYVSGKAFWEAIDSLVKMEIQPKVSQLQQDAGKNPLYPFMPIVEMNRMGRVVARQSSDPDDAKTATRFAMYKQAVFYQRLQAEIYIEPAIDQINREHSICIKDFHDFVSRSIFVPPDRKYIFAKGLYTGFKGDFFTAAHLLIPQLETSIRELCQRKGFIVSKLDDRGIQEEYDLNRLLDAKRFPDITSILDEDTLFDLQGLLVQRSGSNLRNRMAHGLLNDGDFPSPLMSYLWWVALRLCCLPILQNQPQEKQESEKEEKRTEAKKEREEKEKKESNPWLASAGIFENDPFFEEFLEEMAAYRREVDAEIDAAERARQEVVSEESQSE